jgi:hypothetical protein
VLYARRNVRSLRQHAGDTIAAIPDYGGFIDRPRGLTGDTLGAYEAQKWETAGLQRSVRVVAAERPYS